MSSQQQRPPVQRFFFDDSNNLHNAIIALHDFVLPMATAMWHFRHVIDREINSNSPPTASQLARKYNIAPKTRGTTNLIFPFSKITWDEQRQRIAELALVNIIAIYEIWCDEICTKLGRDDLAIRLQFPTNATGTKGVKSAIAELVVTESQPLKSAVYPALTTSKKYSLGSIDALLTCFRYFKELRNAFMHRGRRCDGKLYGAQSAFLRNASKSSLGMDFVPEHRTFSIGDEVDLSLHGVLGFTDVILRIVTTVDAELSRSISAEIEIINRIKLAKKTPMKRPDSLRQVLHTFGIQGVNISADFSHLMKVNQILE